MSHTLTLPTGHVPPTKLTCNGIIYYLPTVQVVKTKADFTKKLYTSFEVPGLLTNL